MLPLIFIRVSMTSAQCTSFPVHASDGEIGWDFFLYTDIDFTFAVLMGYTRVSGSGIRLITD